MTKKEIDILIAKLRLGSKVDYDYVAPDDKVDYDYVAPDDNVVLSVDSVFVGTYNYNDTVFTFSDGDTIEVGSDGVTWDDWLMDVLEQKRTCTPPRKC